MLLAEGLAALGAGLAVIALPWLVLHDSGVGAGLPAAAGVGLAAMLVAWTARGGRRRASSWWTAVSVDILAGAGVLLVQLHAAEAEDGMGQLVLLVGGTALVALAIMRGRAARLRLLPALAERAARPVDATRRLERRLHAAAFATGLALAACLSLLASAEVALWVAGAGFVQAGEAVFVLVPGATEEEDAPSPARRPSLGGPAARDAW